MTNSSFPGDRGPDYAVTDALDTDYYGAFAELPADDLAVRDRARAFAEGARERLVAAWDTAEYPLDVVRELGQTGLLVDAVQHDDLPAQTPLAAGLVNLELSRVDGSLGTVMAVQAGLALRTLALFGSEAQQAEWLGPLHRAEVLGAFALTEPDHGSDAVALETSARRDGDGWVLRGAKKWIGNGASGGITFVWARVDDEGADDHGQVRCFLVPQETPGYEAEVIGGKGSLRGIHQALIRLDDVRLPADALLPGARSFKDASIVLAETRVGVAWSALGHAIGCFEAALAYARQRTTFGTPIGSQQLVQDRLTRMLSEITSMQLHCLRIAELDAAGARTDTQASLAKYHNTRAARRVASEARDLLGGNGILIEYGVIQHMADIEAIHTYEGTESVQALLVGRTLTGTSAFTRR